MSQTAHLWVDKYRPRDLAKLDYATDQAKHLKNLVECGDFPHLLFHGPSGAGKKTRVMCLLRELYGPNVEKLRVELMNFTAPSDKKIAIHAIKSNYHIEINPSDAKFYDRVVVMELLKNLGQSFQLDTNTQREFKVLVITAAESLSRDAQHALRRSMEKYTATCRLILIANSCSQLTSAILSRCLCVRVAAPDEATIVKVINDVAHKENITLSTELSERIARESNRNLRRALLILQSCHARANSKILPDTIEIAQPDWQRCIARIATQMIKEQSAASMQKVRTDFYELLVHNIPKEIIFKYLLGELMKMCDDSIKAAIAQAATLFETRMYGSNKEIFHLEAFCATFMEVYSNNLHNNVGSFDDFLMDM